MEDDSDAILTKLGTGKWTIIYFLAMSYWNFLLPFHTLAGAFMAPYVEHTCRPPPYAHTTNITLNVDDIINNNHSLVPLNYDPSCSFLVQDVATGRLEEEPCTEWDFENSTFTSTVTSEFQLVCGRRYLRATYQSMYMFGMLAGAGSTAFLADRFGRWTMIAISTVSFTIVALGTAWLPSMPTLLAARFLLGSMHPTSLLTGYILVLEVTEVKMRAHIGLFLFLSWALGTMIFSALAYLVRAWRWLQVVVSLPCLLFFVPLWLLGESPRWLAVVGQHQRALKEVKRAAAWNKVTLPPDQELLAIMQRVQQQAASTDKSQLTTNPTKSKIRIFFNQISALFRTPKVRLITVVMCLDYMVGAALFFGLTLGASSLNVDPFLYVAISGIMELPSTTIIIPLTNYFGRKIILISNYSICAVALLCQPLISENLKWLSVSLVMLGKLAGACSFNLVFLYSLELFPTEIRSQGMNAAMVFSRAGSIIAPYIMSSLDSTYPWAISVVFGAASGVAALALLPLWETLNTRLPDTVAELEGYNTPEDKAGDGAGVEDKPEKHRHDEPERDDSCQTTAC